MSLENTSIDSMNAEAVQSLLLEMARNSEHEPKYFVRTPTISHSRQFSEARMSCLSSYKHTSIQIRIRTSRSRSAIDKPITHFGPFENQRFATISWLWPSVSLQLRIYGSFAFHVDELFARIDSSFSLILCTNYFFQSFRCFRSTFIN